MLFFLYKKRPRWDCIIFYVSDDTKMRLDSKFQERSRQDRESWCIFFMRSRWEPSFNEENEWILARFFKNYTSRSGRDRDESTSKILYKSESLCKFSLATKRRLRLPSFTETITVYKSEFIVMYRVILGNWYFLCSYYSISNKHN